MAQVTDDRDLVAQQFQSAKGKSFMRAIAGNPANFDRLHRLAGKQPQSTRQVPGDEDQGKQASANECDRQITDHSPGGLVAD